MCCPGGEAECEDDWDDGQGPEDQRWGCVDTQVSRYHCGGCADSCPTDDLEDLVPAACEAGTCAPTHGSCVDVPDDQQPPPTCDDVCGQEGRPCSATGCGASMRLFLFGECSIGTLIETLNLGCDQPLPAEEIPVSISCCCEN